MLRNGTGEFVGLGCSLWFEWGAKPQWNADDGFLQQKGGRRSIPACYVRGRRVEEAELSGVA